MEDEVIAEVINEIDDDEVNVTNRPSSKSLQT